MGVFREKNPPFLFAVFFLFAAFLLCYPLTELGKLELFRDEGLYAAMALETGSFPVVSTAHGEIIAYTYPLYPLLVKFLHSFGLSMEFSLRFLSVFFLALLSCVVGFVCYQAAFFNCMLSLLRGDFSAEEVRKNAGTEGEKHETAFLTEKEQKKEAGRAGLQAAASGSCLIFATVLAGEKAIEGNPVILTSLLIYGGWLLWFYLGVGKDSWNTAWLLAFLAASLAFYNGGLYALCFFFFPMMFLKRPLKIWTKLSCPGFFIGIFFLLLTILFWEIPRWEGSLAALEEAMPLESFGKYIKNITLAPIDLCLRFLPWTFFLYAPFCPALTAIDRNRLFMKYLRRLLVFALLFFWFNPVTESRDMLLMVPVLATLTALDYWIVVRRYGERLCKVLFWVSICFFVAGTVGILFYVLPENELKEILHDAFDLSFLHSSSLWNVPFFLSLVSVATSFAAWLSVAGKKHRCVWLSLLFLFCSMMAVFWAFTVPFRCAGHVKKETAMTLRRALGKENYDPEMIVYLDGRISGLYDVGYYLGTKIRKVRSAREMEKNTEKELYVISARNMPPGDPLRTWSRLAEVRYQNENLYLWKGALNVRKYTKEEESIFQMQF